MTDGLVNGNADLIAAQSAVAGFQRNPDQLHLLRLINVTMAHQQSANVVLKDLQTQQTQLQLDLSRLDQGQIDESPPYSILLFDRLTDSITRNEVKRESLEESLLSARGAVERASGDVADRQRSINQISESDSALFANLIRTAESELRLAQETLILRRQELATRQTEYSINRLESRFLKGKRDLISPSVVFNKETIDAKTKQLDSRETEIRQKADSIQSDIQTAERLWMDARQKLGTTASPTAELVAEVDALKTALETLRIAGGVNHQRIVRLPIMRQYWLRRYHLVTGQSTRPDRQAWLVETNEQIEQFDRERRSRELALRETTSALASATTQTQEQDLQSEEIHQWLTRMTDSLSQQSDLHNRAIIGIDSGRRALTRLQFELEGGPSRSLQEWAADGWAAIRRCWNYELTRIEDTSLTVGRVLSSLLFIIFGYFAAGLISGLIARRLPKLGVNPAAAHAIESLSFYALVIAFGMTSLRYANVPLTVFTFLGGAVAIGVGFGSQNILNNFISGLILLVERPIKVGDLILIDDTHGTVTQIGARSTQVRTGDNLDIIVPNSKFLENNVVNLTRLDDRLRTSIKIQVAYGSSLDHVMSLLKQAAIGTPGVHSEPEPFVWFNEFGEESLEFEVNFWLSVRSVTQRRDCETLVRLSIDRIFREHGVSIELPRPDMQLSSSTPIELHMVAAAEDAPNTIPLTQVRDRARSRREVQGGKTKPRAAG
ncbi:mechanosensitive ion channel domain-containing protein [Rubripirellula obstinata]|nr:mechanosensitive ion channel domain-containing protein [Rubripirellula obstinata]